MRIVSLNAWGGCLFDALIPYLVSVDADVLCLQEVVHTPNTSSEWLFYQDAGASLAQRANLFLEVQRALPDHQSFFCAAARGPLYADETEVWTGWGIATFVRNTIPVIAQTQAFVHGGYRSDGWGEHPRARNAHAVRIHDDDRTLTIAHMHGLRDPAGKGDTLARRDQVASFLEVIARTQRAGDGLVACGDFNVLPSSETLKALAAAGLRDLVTGGGYVDTRTSHYGKAPRFADYMLVSAEVEVQRFEVVEKPEVSDHRPLLLDLS